MEESNKISFELDDNGSIDNLISKLESANKTVIEVSSSIKERARSIKAELSNLNFSDKTSKTRLKELAEEVVRLQAIYESLSAAAVRTKQVLKDTIDIQNASARSVSNLAKELDKSRTSYAGLEKKLKDVVEAYKELSGADRRKAKGTDMLGKIHEYYNEVKAIDDILKQAMTRDFAPGSIASLKQMISQLEAAYDKLSKADIDAGVGENLLKELQTLQNELQAAIDKKNQYKQVSKQTKQSTQEDIVAEAGSINALKQQLADLSRELDNVSLDKLKSGDANYNQLLEKIKSVQTQLKEAISFKNELLSGPKDTGISDSLSAMKAQLKELMSSFDAISGEDLFKDFDKNTDDVKNLIKQIVNLKVDIEDLEEVKSDLLNPWTVEEDSVISLNREISDLEKHLKAVSTADVLAGRFDDEINKLKQLKRDVADFQSYMKMDEVITPTISEKSLSALKTQLRNAMQELESVDISILKTDKIDKEVANIQKLRSEIQSAKVDMDLLLSGAGKETGNESINQLNEKIKALNAALQNAENSASSFDQILSDIDKHTNSLNQLKFDQQMARFDSSEYSDLIKANAERERALRIKQLEVKANSEAAGSYNQLSIQLEIVQLKLKAMSAAERQTTEEGQSLEQQAKALANQLTYLAESQGRSTRGLEKYSQMYDQLTFSVYQVVRELPAAAINANTFFLAISNNIPILVDNIKKAKLEIAAAKEQGKQVESVTKRIVKAFLSWQTILVAALALLSRYGNEVWEIVKYFARGQTYLLKTKEIVKAIQKEAKDAAKEFSKMYVSFYNLRDAYLRLGTQAERQKWIKNHANDFKQLGVSIKDTVDAENLFIKNSGKFIQSLIAQSMAAAAMKAAQNELDKSFEDLLKSSQSAEALRNIIGSSTKFGDASLLSGDFSKFIEAYTTGALEGVRNKALQTIADWRRKTGNAKPTATTGAGTVGGAAAVGGFSIATDLWFAPEDVKKAQEILDAFAEADRYSKSASERATNAAKMLQVNSAWQNVYAEWMKLGDFTLADQGDKNNTRESKERDLFSYINNMYAEVQRLYNDSLENIPISDIDKKLIQLNSTYQENFTKLNNILEKNEHLLKEKHKALTSEQLKKLKDATAMAEAALDNLNVIYEKDKKLLESQKRVIELDSDVTNLTDRLNFVKNDLESEFALRHSILMNQREIELEENRQLDEKLRRDENAINQKYLLEDYKLRKEYSDKRIELMRSVNGIILNEYAEGSNEYVKAQLENINYDFTKAVNDALVEYGLYDDFTNKFLEEYEKFGENAALAFATSYVETLKGTPAYDTISGIVSGFKKQSYSTQASFYERRLQIKHDLEQSEIRDSNTYAKGLLQLYHELEDINLQIQLAENGLKNLTSDELQTLYNRRDNARSDIRGYAGKYIAQNGLTGFFETAVLGWDDNQVSAFDAAIEHVKNSLSDLLETEIEIREREKELAEERVEAAQSAYDAEIEARNNGYAHSVDTAKKELLLQQKTLRKKQLELEKAQHAQEAVNSLVQASSLVTATAEIWSAFMPMGVPGILLAAIATASMFGAFVAAKAKAAQLTSTYGEGGLEFLKGGSHASGNDIDLHTTNSRGRNMRAEGGEAMAIINKRSTAKYRSILPSLIKSINDGTYLQKYSDSINNVYTEVTRNVNLNNIETSLNTLVNQGKQQVYEFGDTTIVVSGNTRKTIRHYR